MVNAAAFAPFENRNIDPCFERLTHPLAALSRRFLLGFIALVFK